MVIPIIKNQSNYYTFYKLLFVCADILFTLLIGCMLIRNLSVWLALMGCCTTAYSDKDVCLDIRGLCWLDLLYRDVILIFWWTANMGMNLCDLYCF